MLTLAANHPADANQLAATAAANHPAVAKLLVQHLLAVAKLHVVGVTAVATADAEARRRPVALCLNCSATRRRALVTLVVTPVAADALLLLLADARQLLL